MLNASEFFMFISVGFLGGYVWEIVWKIHNDNKNKAYAAYAKPKPPVCQVKQKKREVEWITSKIIYRNLYSFWYS